MIFFFRFDCCVIVYGHSCNSSLEAFKFVVAILKKEPHNNMASDTAQDLYDVFCSKIMRDLIDALSAVLVLSRNSEEFLLENNREVLSLCNCIERCLIFGIKGPADRFCLSHSFWDFLRSASCCTTLETCQLIHHSMTVLKTSKLKPSNSTKTRVWLRYALNKRILGGIICDITGCTSFVRKWYSPWAVMSQQKFAFKFSSALEALEDVKFKMTLQDPTLNLDPWVMLTALQSDISHTKLCVPNPEYTIDEVLAHTAQRDRFSLRSPSLSIQSKSISGELDRPYILRGKSHSNDERCTPERTISEGETEAVSGTHQSLIKSPEFSRKSDDNHPVLSSEGRMHRVRTARSDSDSARSARKHSFLQSWRKRSDGDDFPEASNSAVVGIGEMKPEGSNSAGLKNSRSSHVAHRKHRKSSNSRSTSKVHRRTSFGNRSSTDSNIPRESANAELWSSVSCSQNQTTISSPKLPKTLCPSSPQNSNSGKQHPLHSRLASRRPNSLRIPPKNCPKRFVPLASFQPSGRVPATDISDISDFTKALQEMESVYVHTDAEKGSNARSGLDINLGVRRQKSDDSVSRNCVSQLSPRLGDKSPCTAVTQAAESKTAVADTAHLSTSPVETNPSDLISFVIEDSAEKQTRIQNLAERHEQIQRSRRQLRDATSREKTLNVMKWYKSRKKDSESIVSNDSEKSFFGFLRHVRQNSTDRTGRKRIWTRHSSDDSVSSKLSSKSASK
eukprot:503631_1